jgi:ferredoxin
MRGIAQSRPQGLSDLILRKVLEEHGFDEVPLWKHRPPETRARMKRWGELGRFRDGPVNPNRVEIMDVAAITETVKQRARDLGADVVGCARLTPIMIDSGKELPHENILCIIVGEDYAAVKGGPRSIETESTGTYVRCAEISTELARHIREDLGYPALAHHNGGGEIQAIPAMRAAGFGELGKHGSLIHPELGASHRPGFVTTDLPLAYDRPISFGVQDTCMHCKLCTNNCPGDAIPSKDYTITEGVKRWLTNVERCYVYARLREQYCHICVDVCPYVHKANGDPRKKALYKDYMRQRKRAGYKTPAWFPEDLPAALRESS